MRCLALAGPLSATPTGLEAALDQGFRLRIDVLEDWLLRVAILPDEGLRVDRGWMIDPAGDLPWEGRDRLSLHGFGGIEPVLDDTILTAADWRVLIEPEPLRLVFQRRVAEGWQTVVQDRPVGAYQWMPGRGVFRHYQARTTGTRHYGLGDKTGPLDRTGRRLRCLQTDSLGYNAETTDPLYKHVPFVIADEPGGPATGILYDTLSEITFDLGAEHSNYFPHYRHVEAIEKGLVYHLIAGPKLSDIVPRLMHLTGKPHLPPRWSFGFAFTTMHHADHPQAQRVMTDFAERCRAEGYPISAIHSGSGYTTKEDGRRYVFTWNESKFPDREGFFRRLTELGFHTCANIKPVLLTEHPAYGQAESEGWFVKREDGKPAIEQFWGGLGASLDMTNPATLDWWKKGVSDQVLGAGFSSGWNDNNEAELSDETATIDGFGQALPAIDVRPVHALLMTRATFEATQAKDPDKRPYTVSRAGPIGIARYGETWTGDNFTSWHTLKWNLRQALSMSISGMPLTGHDIGGFDGPKPGPELFVRFMQMMALHPRAVMNSWKPQLAEPTNLPWMHAEVTEHVKAALTLRYRFLPYLYDLAYKAHRDGTPLMAPLFYHFDNEDCRRDQDAFMLGADLLVAPVTEEGATTVTVHAPATPGGWIDFETLEPVAGGGSVTLQAPLARLPMLVRAGAILPLAAQWEANAPHDPTLIELTAFPGAGSGESRRSFFHDDGISWAFRNGEAPTIRLGARWDEGAVELALDWSGNMRTECRAVLRDRSGRASVIL
jgi:alpha-glucosidase